MSASVVSTIGATVAAFCGAHANPDALVAIANRESRLTPTAIGDLEAGPRAYEKERDELVAMGNPYANEPGRWAGSFGLYQLMPAYYARLWGAKADPGVLFDPRIATVVAGRVWNKAVQAGARSFISVRLFWAYGRIVAGPGEPQYEARKDEFSIVDGVMDPPTSRFDYRGFGTGPQADQLQKIGATGSSTSLVPMLLLAGAGYYAWKRGLFHAA